MDGRTHGRTKGWTHDRHNAMTIACWPSASGFKKALNFDIGVFNAQLHYCNTKFFTTQSRLLMTLKEKAFENNVGKGKNAGNRHFLLFPQCLLLFPKQVLIFHSNAFNLD